MQINRKAASLMIQYAEQHGTDDVEKLVQYAHALSAKYGEAAAALACQMYDQTAEAYGAAVASAEPAKTATIEETTRAINNVMQKSKLTKSIGNVTSKLVKQCADDTTMQNAKRDQAEFAWIPSGDGCSFCEILASNGWKKATESTAKGNHAQHVHENCKCTFAVRFSSDGGVDGYHPGIYKDQYDNAGGENWRDKLRSMDRDKYAENSDEINARKRAEYKRRTELSVSNEDGQK